jgi:hypothetical protein
MSIEDDDAIVSLEAWRLLKRPATMCQHLQTVLDRAAGTVACRDCGAFLSAFHVLTQVANEENRWHARVKAMRAEVAELKAWSPFLKAVKHQEGMWRGKRQLPCCPHCGTGLWATELTVSSHGVRREIAFRKRNGKPLPAGVGVDDGLTVIRP